jgi:hypothetical protein
MHKRPPYRYFSRAIILASAFLFLLAQPASSERYLYGVCSAESINDPVLGAWKYTIELSWDTEMQYAQSHINIGIPLELCPCSCESYYTGITVVDTSGTSTGSMNDDPCTVYYYSELNCGGDPSIPGFDLPLIKFEPYEDLCAPSVVGEGIFWFYSNWPPAAVTTPNNYLSMKYDTHFSVGEILGVMPDCQCQPTPAQTTTWGTIKKTDR